MSIVFCLVEEQCEYLDDCVESGDGLEVSLGVCRTSLCRLHRVLFNDKRETYISKAIAGAPSEDMKGTDGQGENSPSRGRKACNMKHASVTTTPSTTVPCKLTIKPPIQKAARAFLSR